MLRHIFGKSRTQRRPRKAHLSFLDGKAYALDMLEKRALMATFLTLETSPNIPGLGVVPGEVLVVRGDSSPDTIVVSTEADGTIVIGSVPLKNVVIEDEFGNPVVVSNNSEIDALVILGNAGNDRISTENYGQLQLVDTDGDGVVDDTVLINEQNIYILAGSGNDQVVGGPNGEYIDGGASNDLICAGYGNDEIHGDSPSGNFGYGADTVDAGPGDDAVYGWGGADYLNGNTGDDYLDGGDGNDRLCGAEGFDFLVGGYGSDFLNGGYDDDVMYGDTGVQLDDVFYGGTDYADSGGGYDLFIDYSVAAVNYYNPGFPDPLDPFNFGQIVAVGSKNFQRRIWIDCPEIICPVIRVDYSELNSPGGGRGGQRM